MLSKTRREVSSPGLLSLCRLILGATGNSSIVDIDRSFGAEDLTPLLQPNSHRLVRTVLGLVAHQALM
jgi:hypothetical protein